MAVYTQRYTKPLARSGPSPVFAASLSVCFPGLVSSPLLRVGSLEGFWSCWVGVSLQTAALLEFLPLGGGLVPTKQKSGKDIELFLASVFLGFLGLSTLHGLLRCSCS